MPSLQVLLIITLAAAISGCVAHHAPAVEPVPVASVPARGVLKISSSPVRARAKRTLPPAPVVMLSSPEERFTFAILDTFETGLDRAQERSVAKAIVSEGKRQGFDPFLLLALIRVESSGWNWAQSSVQARGLMQIRPYVGRQLAHGTAIVWQGPDTLHEPVANVHLGVKYLAQLRDRFGSLELALAAYNVGPSRLQDRLQRGERTVEYAAKILFFAERYRSLCPEGSDLAPRIATVTVGLARLESEIGGKPSVALALARRRSRTGGKSVIANANGL